MAVTINGTTGVTFNDATIQGTAAVVNTSSVLNATAGLTAGAVGTYAFVGNPVGAGFTKYAFGSNYATGLNAGQLSLISICATDTNDTNVWFLANFPGNQNSATISGTWKYLGSSTEGSGNYLQYAIAVRVA